MKKLLILLILIGALFSIAPSAGAVSLNDFNITNYDISYYLKKDSNNRSVLETRENITVDFKNPNVNHGIERSLVNQYDKHPTSLKIDSVTDQNNMPTQYTTRTSDDSTILRIGDPNKYVFGKVVYQIKYTHRDVTKFFSDSNSEEWYWDTNGTEWKVPIDKLNIEIKIDDSLKTNMTGQMSCYFGAYNSTEKCNIIGDDTFKITAQDLNPYENVTVAFGFNKGTFAKYKMSLLQIYLMLCTVLNFLMFITFIPVVVLLSVWLVRKSDRKKDRKTVVTQFTPPKDSSVSVAGTILRSPGSIFASQILDLAVRHYIKIYQTKEKSLFKKAEYDLEISKDISKLKDEEKELLTDLFGGTPKVGQRFEMKSLAKSYSIRSSLLDNDKKIRDLIKANYALRAKDNQLSASLIKKGLILLIISILTINLGLIIISLILIISSFAIKPLTEKGLELARYLDGLKNYIKIAEVERLKMLQSTEGAEKVGQVDVNDKAQLIKLYEKVLPYAVLFGLEKSWNNQLGEYYKATDTSPTWIYGTTGAINAMNFTDSLNSFTSPSNYGGGSYSSSGGSGGGGFSGGGGGGGGGGGW